MRPKGDTITSASPLMIYEGNLEGLLPRRVQPQSMPRFAKRPSAKIDQIRKESVMMAMMAMISRGIGLTSKQRSPRSECGPHEIVTC